MAVTMACFEELFLNLVRRLITIAVCSIFISLGHHILTVVDLNNETAAPTYSAILSATGCSNASDSVACLRTVPIDILSSVLNSSATANAVRTLNPPLIHVLTKVVVGQTNGWRPLQRIRNNPTPERQLRQSPRPSRNEPRRRHSLRRIRNEHDGRIPRGHPLVGSVQHNRTNPTGTLPRHPCHRHPRNIHRPTLRQYRQHGKTILCLRR